MKILHFIVCIMLPISIINNGYTNQNYLRKQVVKFESGDLMCSLASLNQCLSALNTGGNKILKDFKNQYDRLLN